MPIYALGVTLGISRKMQEEPGRIVDSRLNRPVKWTGSRMIGMYGHLSDVCVYKEWICIFSLRVVISPKI